jgi:DNA-binding transcriptional ArsR family regulator
VTTKETSNPQQLFGEAAELFKALAHPLRLRLVCGLLDKPDSQTGIARMLGLPQSSLAQHVAVLRRAGIIRGRREGSAELILSVADERVPGIFREVCGGDDFLHYTWEHELAQTDANDTGTK